MYCHRLVLFIIILVCHFNCPAFANNSSEKLNQAEKYVIEQVKKGEVADLSNVQKEHSILRADFLKNLLTGSFQGLEVTKKGIHIYGARIKEKLDISNEIIFPVSLNCTFDKDVIFNQTKFSGEANFHLATFSKRAIFHNAIFSRGADFRSARFGEGAAFFKATFFGDANFSQARFSWADFRGIRVYGGTNFEMAEFFGEAGFSFAKFSRKAIFSTIEFSGEANFERAKFSGGADIIWNIFSKGANFSQAEFSGETNFEGSRFSEVANFERAKFSGGADFREVSLRKAKLLEAQLHRADLGKADLSEADLRRANLSEANLSEAVLFKANLDGTNLKLAVLRNSDLRGADMIYAEFNLADLSRARGLIELRENFKKAGFREKERNITYVFKHTQRKDLWEKNDWFSYGRLESLFYYIFFELTCQYGMKPARPLVILISLIPLFSILYIFALRTKKKENRTLANFF